MLATSPNRPDIFANESTSAQMTTKKVAVIDYGLGNVGSIRNMLRRIGVLSEIVADPAQLASMDRAILPGIGNFGHGMRLLHEGGWVKPIRQFATQARRPLLGICLGMQLLANGSEEGEGKGLELVDGSVRFFDTARMQKPLPVPHMGWTDVPPPASSRLMAGLPADVRFYFVHSLHLETSGADGATAIYATYGYPFACAVEKANIFGVQFHPEKSHAFGMALLKNFCEVSC